MSGVTAATAAIENEVRDAPPDVHLEDDSTKQLDRLRPVTELLAGDRLGLLYRRWQVNPFARKGWTEVMWGDGEEERDQLPALAGINWGHMYGAFGRWHKMSRVGEAIAEGAGQASGALRSVWQGPAADAARDKFDELIGGAADFQYTAAWLAYCVNGAWQTSREPVYDLGRFLEGGPGAEFVSIYRGDGNEQQVGQRSLDIDAFEVAAAKGFPTVEHLRRADLVGPSPQEIHWRLQWVMGGYPALLGNIRWLDDMCQRYCDVVRSLRERIRNTYRAVDDNFRNLGDAMDSLGWGAGDRNANPFAKLEPPKEQPPDTAPADHDTDPSGTPEDGGPPDRSGGFGGPPGGSGGPPPGGGGSFDPGAAAGPPPVPGGSPAQSTPADPAAVAEPEPGGPGSPEAPAGDPATVRITDGDRTISMSSPDGRGHVTVTVDDGTNPPKRYDLNLGGGEASGAGPAVAGQIPAQGGNPRPDGSTPGGARPVPAGDDGTCVIRDGPMTITAHRPPNAPDTVVVTVDDGTGQPRTYTVDYNDPAGPAARDTAGEPVPGQPGTASGATGFGGTASGSAYSPGSMTAAVADPGQPGPPAAADDPGQGHSPAPGAGVAGATVPPMGGAGTGAGEGDAQRAPSGSWRRAGDLFEEPPAARPVLDGPGDVTTRPDR